MDTKEIGESALPEAMPWDSIKPAIKPELDSIKPFLAELQSRYENRTAQNADFTFARDRLQLAQKLMQENNRQPQ